MWLLCNASDGLQSWTFNLLALSFGQHCGASPSSSVKWEQNSLLTQGCGNVKSEYRLWACHSARFARFYLVGHVARLEAEARGC